MEISKCLKKVENERYSYFKELTLLLLVDLLISRLIDYLFDWLINFNRMLARYELFHANNLGNNIRCSFIFLIVSKEFLLSFTFFYSERGPIIIKQITLTNIE